MSTATPRVALPRVGTYGTFPQVRGPQRVNEALRAEIVSDQKAFAQSYPRRRRGFYETELDRNLVSASSVVVSALIPRSRSVLPLRKGADGWVGITLRVPSGGRVDVRSLFRPGAPAVIAERIRRDPFLPAAMRRHPSPAVARAAFALLPNGLAVGVSWAFWREDLVVPYRLLEAQLTPFGRRLAAAARWPDYRTDARHFTFCRRPDLSGAELSATGGVPCAVAHALERAVFSQRCINRIRCEAAGITCRAYWDGRYDRPFDFTHHAICRGPAGRVVMDEG